MDASMANPILDEEEKRRREEEERQRLEAERVKVENGKATIGPTNRPFTEDQSFLLNQRKAVRATKSTRIKTGDLEKLPAHLEPAREMLTEKNKKGEIIPSSLNDWHTNRIRVDYSSIKDNRQAAYYATTLETDDDKKKFFKEYAKSTGRNYYSVMNEAEAMLGKKLFAEPQTQTAKIRTYNQGLSEQGLYDIEGNPLNLTTASQPQIEQALRMMPDNAKALEYYEKLCATRGWKFDKSALSYMENADLSAKDYKNAVEDYNSLFTFGYSEANATAYGEALSDIQSGYASPCIRRHMEDALKKSYEARTGRTAPSKDEILAALAQEEADAIGAEGEKKHGFLNSFFGLFKGKDEVKKEEKTVVQASAGNGSVIASGGTVTVGGQTMNVSKPVSTAGAMPPKDELFPASSYGAAGSAPVVDQGNDALAASSYAAAGNVSKDSMQGGKPAEVQDPAQKKIYERAVPYDPNMTDEQAFAEWQKGGTLDPRNKAQIEWFTDDPAIAALAHGVNPKDMDDLGWDIGETSNVRYDGSQFWQYGYEIASAAKIIDSHIMPDDMNATAILDLGRAVKTLRDDLANPEKGIVVPEGEHAFAYMLTLPQYAGVLSEIREIQNAQTEVIRINTENEIKAKQEQEALVADSMTGIKSGNSTPEMLSIVADHYAGGEYVNVNEDETYIAMMRQLGPFSDFFDDRGKFWNSNSAAAIYGQNLKALGKGYGDFKSTLKREAEEVLFDYTVAASRMGMTLEEYMGSAGLDDINQVIGVAFNGMCAAGAAYGRDPEAQAAVQTVAESPESVGLGKAAGIGAERAFEETMARFADATYHTIKSADYQTFVRENRAKYVSEYGDEAARMWYSDLMAVAESGELGPESKEELLRDISEASDLFDICYEIKPGFLESLLREPADMMQKDVERLDGIIAKMPDKERWTANLIGSGVNMLSSMAVASTLGAVSGSAMLGSMVAYGVPAANERFYSARSAKADDSVALYMSLLYGGAIGAMNAGGTDSMIGLWGDMAMNTQKQAFMSKGYPALIKSSLKLLHKQGAEEAGEEAGEAIFDWGFDAAQDAVIAYSNGEIPKVSDALERTVNNLYETDVAALGKEILTNAGLGYVMGGVAALGGVAKSGYSAAKGAKMHKRFGSIDLSAKLINGEVEFTEENVGKVWSLVKEDLQDPEYRRWIDSANAMAHEQNNMVTAAMLGAGHDARKAAVKEADRAADYRAKEAAAKTAAETSKQRWIELRQQVMDGDLTAVPMMTTAQQQMGKDYTAMIEAKNAAEKAEEAATEKTREWLAACGAFNSNAMEYYASRAIAQRNAYARALEMLYELEEAEAARLEEEARLEAASNAAAEAEIAYAESAVFGEETEVPESNQPDPTINAETAADNVIEQLDQLSEAVEAGDADAQASLTSSITGTVKKAVSALDTLFDRAYDAYRNVGDSNVYNELAKRYNAVVAKLKEAGADIGDRSELPTMDEAAFAPTEPVVEEAPATVSFAAYREEEHSPEEILAKAMEDESTQADEAEIEAYAEKASTLTDEPAMEEAKALTSELKELNAAATDAIDGGMDDDTVLAIAKNINTVTRKILALDDALAQMGETIMASEEYAYAKEMLGRSVASAVAWPSKVRKTLGAKKLRTEAKAEEKVEPVKQGEPAPEIPATLSAEGEAALEAIYAKRANEKIAIAEAKKKADAKAAAREVRKEQVYEITGAGNKPERQARQINQVVADEASTVEDIDRTVERIEGVSMAMASDEKPQAETKIEEQGGDELIETQFKDPVMQKMAKDLEKNWGIKLRLADLDPRDEGFYDRNSNTIVLNKRLGSGEKMRSVVVHELIHFCEQQPWYKQFRQDILNGAYSGESEIEENRKRLREMGYKEDELDFELVAHAAKPLFDGDELLIGNLIENGKASAVKRAYAAISQFIARRKAKKMGMGKQYDALLSARKTLAKGLKDAKATGGEGVQRSVQKDAFGKSYVKIDRDILDGVDPADWEMTVKNTLAKNYPNGIKVGSHTFVVSEKTRREWTRSGYSQWLYNNDQAIFADKMRAADNADELLLTANDYVSETPRHPRKDRVANFARGNVRMSIGGKDYSAEVVTGGFKSGSVFLYDIVNIKPISIQKSRSLLTAPDDRSFNRSATASDNSISENISVVNDQSTQNGISYSRTSALSQYGNKTAQEIDWINQTVKDRLKGTEHEVTTDRMAIQRTLERIADMGGVNDALRDLMSRPYDRWNADDHVMAQALMAKAEYDGDVTTETMIAMVYNKARSEAGLTLQKGKLLAGMNVQNALALAARMRGDFNLKHGGSSQYAPVGNGRPLEASGDANDPASKIIDRAKRINEVILAERGMNDIVERDNRWGIPLTGAKMYLIERYGLEKVDLPGIHYNTATLKQRMLCAILATDTNIIHDTDMDGNANGLLGLIQQLEAMRAGKAVETIADLTYIANQMAEAKTQSNGSEEMLMNTQEARTAFARAYDATQNIIPVTFGQKASAVAYMNMLSASTTGVKNVLGNVVMAPMEAVSETIATGIDKAVSKITGNRTTAVSTSAEVMEGLRAGLEEVATTFADTFIYQADTSQGRRYEASGGQQRVFQHDLFERKRRMVDMIMQMGDRPFFKAEYARQLATIKRLCADGKMKKKDVTTTKDGRQVVSYTAMTETDMHKEAAQRALERVFQEDNAIVSWMNSMPASIRPFAQAIVPFIKTPTNIAMRMLDYTPVGLAKTILADGVIAAKRDGGFDQRRFVMGMGRGLTGTGMIMIGAVLSNLGWLEIEDGYGEEDDSRLYGAGMANYDPYGKYIRIGYQKIALDWTGPAGIWMTIGAAAAAQWDDDTSLGDKLWSTVMQSGPEVVNLLFDNTMLSSLSDLLGGAEDGEDLGKNAIKTVGGSMLQQYFSPADIRQLAKFTDPYERDYRHDNPIIEAINKNVIRYWPIARQTLPVKYDMTGDPVRQASKYGWGREDEHVLLNFMNMYMSPTNIQSDKGDAALSEVIDLAYRAGDTGCVPKNPITTNGNVTITQTMAKKTSLDYKAGENKLTLSADETRKYNQMYASLCFNGTERGVKYKKVGMGDYEALEGIRDLIDSREYKRMNDQERVKAIEAIQTAAWDIVRAQICIDRGYAK